MCAEHCRARKGRPRTAAPKTLPGDLFAYAADPAPDGRERRRSPLRIVDVETLPVIDDWPGTVPVTMSEIEIFERHFGDVLDRLFGPIEGDTGSRDLSELTPDGNNGS